MSSAEDAQEHARLSRLFGLGDLTIDAGFLIIPAAVWDQGDGTLAKAPLTQTGHLEAHRDKQLLRQQLIAPYIPARVPSHHEQVIAFVPGSHDRGVFDCDAKHGKVGLQTLQDLIAQYGNFVGAAWRTPSGGINVLFAKPPGSHYGNTSPWAGIDVRVDGGWVVAPGNVCSLGQWEWIAPSTFATVKPPPGPMIVALTPTSSNGSQPKVSTTEVRAFIDASPTDTSLPAMQAFDGELKRFRSSSIGSRHDALKRIVGWACGMEALDMRWSIEKIKGEWQDLTAGEGREDEVTDLLGWTVAQEQRARKGGSPKAPAPVIDAYRNLPDDFWQRPLLAAIRKWAHSRHRSADAVYACARARYAATIPWTLRVDTGIATPVSLNLLTAIVADSGVGKSTAMAMADELVAITRTDIFVGPLGSGEGMTEAFYDEVVVPNPQTGKNEKVKMRVRDAALFDLDEGEALTKLGTRTGALLLPELRKAYSGRELGQSNASITTRRSLAANSYRLVLIVGLQPEAALAVLSDAGTGTPQRFVLFNGGDPTIPDVAATAALPMIPPHPPAITGSPHLMTVEAVVLAEIHERDLAVQRGTLKVAQLDSHRPANQIKEAAILACLDGRPKQISAEDWALAGMVLDTSDALRAAILATRAEAEQRAAEARGSRDAVVEGARERKLVAALADRIVAHVPLGAGVSRAKLRKQLTAGTTRHRFEAAVEAAVADGKITDDGSVLKVRK